MRRVLGRPFVEDAEHAGHDQEKAKQVIPLKLFLEIDGGERHEYNKRDRFLHDLQLIAGPSFKVADAVGRHLEAVFKEGDQPTDEDDFP